MPVPVVFNVLWDNKTESSPLMTPALCCVCNSPEHLSSEDFGLAHFITPKFFDRFFFFFSYVAGSFHPDKITSRSREALDTGRGDGFPKRLLSVVLLGGSKGSLARSLASLPGSWWLVWSPLQWFNSGLNCWFWGGKIIKIYIPQIWHSTRPKYD